MRTSISVCCFSVFARCAKAPLPALLAFASAACVLGAGVPEQFAVTNCASDSATIVWVSRSIEAGRVEFAESAAALEARSGSIAVDDAGASRAHHVTLGEVALFDSRLSSGRPPLRSRTTYTFDIVSGGVRYDNGGAHFSFSTAAPEDPGFVLPAPGTVSVAFAKGGAPPVAVVKYRLTRPNSGGAQSQWGSALALHGEARILDLAQLLDSRLTGRWPLTETQDLEVTALSASGSTTTVVVAAGPSGLPEPGPTLVLPPPNRPPVASAGSDQTSIVGRSVDLQGWGFDPDGDALSYRWTADGHNPPGGSLNNVDQATSAFVAAAAGTYLLALTVTDSRGATAGDTMAVVVDPATGTSNDHAERAGATLERDLLVTRSAPGVGRTTRGELTTSTEEDWFAFMALRGYVYRVQIVPEKLVAPRVRVFATDGHRLLLDTAHTERFQLPEFRPNEDGYHYVRVSSDDGLSSGTYVLGVGVAREDLVAPPRATVSLAPAASGYRATIRSAGSSMPLADYNVRLSFDGGALVPANAQKGPGAGNFLLGFPAAPPTQLALDFQSAPMQPLATGATNAIAYVDFDARAGVRPGPESVAILSVTATNNATTVQVLRPTADSGLARSVSQAQLEGGRFRLDGRRSSDPNRPARTLRYSWRQTGGRGVTLDDSASPSPSFPASEAGLYRFSLVVSNGILDSTSSTVTVGLDLARLAPFASIGAQRADSGPVADATTGPLDVVLGERLLLSMKGSSDPRRQPLTPHWTQLEGPTIEVAPNAISVTFAPVQAGRYVLQLVVSNSDGLESRPTLARLLVRAPSTQPARLDLTAVSSQGEGEDLGDVPELSMARILRVQTGETVSLAGQVTMPAGAAAQRASFYWRQLAGPAVELEQRGAREDSDLPDSYADFTPSEAGVCEFECGVRLFPSGTQLARRVRVVVDRPGRPVPAAAAIATATRPSYKTGQPPSSDSASAIEISTLAVVTLSGSGSSGQGGPLAFRWVQIAGPEVSLSNADSAVTTFVPASSSVASLYAFQLFVDDGLRSPPAVVTVQVQPSGSQDSGLVLEPGLNLVSLPLLPALDHVYTVADLAADTGSPFVSWIEKDPNGNGRFRTWLPSGRGEPPAIRPVSGYVVLNRQRARLDLPFRGSTWPTGSWTWDLARGTSLMSCPPRGRPIRGQPTHWCGPPQVSSSCAGEPATMAGRISRPTFRASGFPTFRSRAARACCWRRRAEHSALRLRRVPLRWLPTAGRLPRRFPIDSGAIGTWSGWRWPRSRPYRPRPTWSGSCRFPGLASRPFDAGPAAASTSSSRRVRARLSRSFRGRRTSSSTPRIPPR